MNKFSNASKPCPNCGKTLMMTGYTMYSPVYEMCSCVIAQIETEKRTMDAQARERVAQQASCFHNYERFSYSGMGGCNKCTKCGHEKM